MMMEYANTILLSLLPALAVVTLVYWRDKYQREPILWVLLTFIFGLLVGGVIYYIQNWLTLRQPAGYQGALVHAFVTNALVVETFRILALYLIAKINRHFDEKQDGIIYAVILSMGFATFDTLSSFFAGGVVPETMSQILFPAVGNVFLNLVLAVAMGGLFADYYFERRNNVFLFYAIYTFIIAFSLHAAISFIILTLPFVVDLSFRSIMMCLGMLIAVLYLILMAMFVLAGLIQLAVNLGYEPVELKLFPKSKKK